MRNKFPKIIQKETKDCGPTCLQIISKFYGKGIPIQRIRDYAAINREGSNLAQLSEAAEKLGFRTIALKDSYETLSCSCPSKFLFTVIASKASKTKTSFER